MFDETIVADPNFLDDEKHIAAAIYLLQKAIALREQPDHGWPTIHACIRDAGLHCEAARQRWTKGKVEEIDRLAQQLFEDGPASKTLGGFTGGFMGETICSACNRTYANHPVHEEHTWLRVLCSGQLVRLEAAPIKPMVAAPSDHKKIWMAAIEQFSQAQSPPETPPTSPE